MALFIKAAALFAALLAAPSVAPQQVTPPVDLLARAKAPHEPGKLVDIVAAINAYVNTHIEGESDLEHYGMPDFWVMYPADGKGDCEDYVLTKLGLLQQAGVPAISELKIVSVLVHYKDHGKEKIEGHAILALRLPNKTVIYLDNMKAEPMTRAELVKAGYVFFDWIA